MSLRMRFVTAKHHLIALRARLKRKTRPVNEELETKTDAFLCVNCSQSPAGRSRASPLTDAAQSHRTLCSKRVAVTALYFVLLSFCFALQKSHPRCFRDASGHEYCIYSNPKTLTLFMKAIIISSEVRPVCRHRAADLRRSFCV